MQNSAHILVVNDNPDTRRSLSALMKYAGYEVTTAETGGECLSLLETLKPDLILLDVIMPDLNGIEVCQRIKTHPRWADIYVLMLSGLQTASEQQVAGLAAGAEEYITLPIPPTELIARVQTLLRIKHKEQTLRYAETRFRLLLEHSTDAVALLTSEGKLLYANPAASHITGYPPYKLTTLDVFDIVHPEDAERLRDEFMELLHQPGHTLRKEFRYRHHNGEWRWLDSIGTNLLDQPGVNAIVVNYRDITARKHEEEARQQRERELAVISLVSAALRAATTRAEILPIVLSELSELLKADSTALVLRESATDTLAFETATSVWASLTGTPVLPEASLSGQIISTGKHFISNHARTEQFRSRPIMLGKLDAVLGMPLNVQGQVIGVAWVGRNQAFTESEVRLMSAIADIAAIAIQRTTLHEQSKRHAEQVSAVSDIGRTLAETLDLTEIYARLTQSIHDLLPDITAIYLSLYDAKREQLRCVYGEQHKQRINENELPTISTDSESQARQSTVIHGREPLIIGKRETPETRRTRPPTFTGPLVQSSLYVPMLAHGEVLGVLQAQSAVPDRFTPTDAGLLMVVANTAAIAIQNARLFNDLQRSNNELAQAYDATIAGWSRALDMRDQETEGHSQRVTDLTLKLAQRIGLSSNELIPIRRGALLHDIGKMAIPDGVLLKPGKLNDEEWAIMRQHPFYAYAFLQPIAFLKPALDIPYCHHEKWDGTGYPRGLAGEQIPLAARLFSVVDVWDALTSDRPYRLKWPTDKALEYIQSLAGTHFDPQVVEVFLEMMK
jgi:PAS domain S-box-containing protein